MLCVRSTRSFRWGSGIDIDFRLRWSLNGILNGGVVYCGRIGLGRFGCGLMDGGVGLRIMWRNGEDSGRRNSLKCGGVCDTIAGKIQRKTDDDCGGIGMSLKIRLKNLGILKHAEFSLGDLTVICGENNTGKTYAAYALYGFLDSWIKHDPFSR